MSEAPLYPCTGQRNTHPCVLQRAAMYCSFRDERRGNNSKAVPGLTRKPRPETGCDCYRVTSLMKNIDQTYDSHRAVGKNLLKGPREGLFLVSEVPLYAPHSPRQRHSSKGRECHKATFHVGAKGVHGAVAAQDVKHTPCELPICRIHFTLASLNILEPPLTCCLDHTPHATRATQYPPNTHRRNPLPPPPMEGQNGGSSARPHAASEKSGPTRMRLTLGSVPRGIAPTCGLAKSPPTCGRAKPASTAAKPGGPKARSRCARLRMMASSGSFVRVRMMRGDARQGLLGHPSRGCPVIRTGVAATTSNSGVFKPARLRDSSWAASTAGATWYRRRSDDKHWSIDEPLPACPRATRSRTSARSRSPPNSKCSDEEHPDTSSSLWGDLRGGVVMRTARD